MKLYTVEFLGFVTLDSYNSFFTIEKGSLTYAILIKNHAESENDICFAQNAIVTEMEKIPRKIFENVSMIFTVKLIWFSKKKVKHMVGDGNRSIIGSS